MADPVPLVEKASVSGFVTDLGMEKATESPEEDLVTSTDTSNFASPISPDDDMWQTIARESMSYWDNIAHEADLRFKGKNGLLENDEIVIEHVTDSRLLI